MKQRGGFVAKNMGGGGSPRPPVQLGLKGLKSVHSLRVLIDKQTEGRFIKHNEQSHTFLKGFEK